MGSTLLGLIFLLLSNVSFAFAVYMLITLVFDVISNKEDWVKGKNFLKRFGLCLADVTPIFYFVCLGLVLFELS